MGGGVRPEIHEYPKRPRSGSALGDASADFAANAKQLSDLARAALAARDAGDMDRFNFFIAQYRALNGQLAPEQKVAVAASLKKEMPSDLMMKLASVGDTFSLSLASLTKNLPLMVGLGVALYLLVQHGGGRRE